MKITYQELSDVRASLLKILSASMDPKLAYRLSKIAGKVGSAFRNIEKERRRLVEQYGEKKGDTISVPEKRMEKFQADSKSYLNQEFELDIQLIPWNVIVMAGIKISPTDLVDLEKFIDLPPKID